MLSSHIKIAGYLSVWFLSSLFILNGQQRITLSGIIEDTEHIPLEGILVIAEGKDTVTVNSQNNGRFELKLIRDETYSLRVASITHKAENRIITAYGDRTVNFEMSINTTQIDAVEIHDTRTTSNNIIRISPKTYEFIPTSVDRVIAAVKALPGVSSNNELSSQYTVRGGNFDENLVYVNDFEIFRPFLIRSGQQEGLSFINSDLVQAVEFSAGGFEARFGDKLSSVLNVQYKKPRDKGGSVTASLLGNAFHLHGIHRHKRLTYLLGVRQQSNQYLLNTLPTQGSYNPLFLDIQSYFTYALTSSWELQWINNLTRNRYQFVPDSENIRFGTVQDALNIRVAWDGQENDRYDVLMSGLGAVYRSEDRNLQLKFMSSVYLTNEREAYDLIGSYYVGEVENNLGESEFGEVTRERGIGIHHNWARNKLNGLFANLEHRGFYDKKNHLFYWGAKYQREQIDDKISEWSRIDSAGYSFPVSDSQLVLSEILKTDITLASNRISGFVQDQIRLFDDKLSLTAGVRLQYWTVNKEPTLTPRVQIGWKPLRNKQYGNGVANDSLDIQLRFSAGMYYQPPFYRELRNAKGILNKNLLAQKSLHLVLGGDLHFYMWGRPFKFTAEAYYKPLWDLVTYDVKNVLIRYSGLNNARGYAAGADFRLYGEFVDGVDSWFSLGILNTREDFENDAYYQYYDADGQALLTELITDHSIIADSSLLEPGYIRRPSDQLLNCGIFFQDYVPGKKNLKMNLNLLFGTPLPFSPPGNPKLRNVYSTPIYFRTDIGFSALLYQKGRKEIPDQSLFNRFENIWLGLEVFNLLGVSNTVSYNWLIDFGNRVYAVPNRLTSRRINLRLVANF